MADHQWEADMLALRQMAAIDSDDEWLDMVFQHYSYGIEPSSPSSVR